MRAIFVVRRIGRRISVTPGASLASMRKSKTRMAMTSLARAGQCFCMTGLMDRSAIRGGKQWLCSSDEFYLKRSTL
jgi:hypothetical protein